MLMAQCYWTGHGSNMPRDPIFSNTNKASLSFHSDGYDQFKGFRVEWEEAPDCKNKIKGNKKFPRQITN